MKDQKLFRNRTRAGEALARRLSAYAGRDDVTVLALPRGGVPVGAQIARHLGVPLDILLVRKLGLPGREECAMGTIASGGVCVLQAEILSALEIPTEVIEKTAQRELQEIRRREKLYRAGRPAPHIREHVVILADDGLATASTMQVAAHVVRESNPARLIIAVPVAPAETCEKLKSEADEVIFLRMPEPFHSVGHWYENFEQTGDEEVASLLEQVRQEAGRNAGQDMCQDMGQDVGKKREQQTHPMQAPQKQAGGTGNALHSK